MIMSHSDVGKFIGPPKGPSLGHHVIDFANMLKAFIGSNYLTIAFAFRQSGISVGLAGLIIIATLTAHCCRLLVKCKYHAIKLILTHHSSSCSSLQGFNGPAQLENSDDSTDSDRDSSDESDFDVETMRKKLLQNFNYGDIGRLCMGKTGLTLVNTAVVITQFGFCVGYYIFVGNTVQSMFPLYNCSVPFTNSTVPGMASKCLEVKHVNSLNVVHVDMEDMTETLPGVLHNKKVLPLQETSETTGQFQNRSSSVNSTTSDIISSFSRGENVTFASNQTTVNATVFDFTVGENISETDLLSSRTASSYPVSVNTTAYPSVPESSALDIQLWTQDPPLFNTTSSAHLINQTEWKLMRGKHVPDLRLLVIAPAVLFITMTLIRNLRHMGFISFIANFSIFVGCFEVLAYLFSDISVSSTFKWVNWRDLPVFFGMVTGAYEGIGTILPIESSMEGNRHNFFKFLYGAVAVLTLVLSSFGVLGYLKFGDSTEQMINANIPSGNMLGVLVNGCLCVGVLLTFPLMMFPVIEMAELYVFGEGQLCGPKPVKTNTVDHQSLLHKKQPAFVMPVAEKISDSVPTWKRNSLRIFIVLSAGGLAVLLRNYFAYISAFVGALGSTTLAYILPCLFHLKLCWAHLPLAVKVKDITIIIVGVFCCIAGVYSVVLEILSSSHQS